MEWKKLYEVKQDVILSDEDNIILEKGERVYIEMKPGYEWPRCHGYDVAFMEEDDFEDYFKEVK